MPASETEELHAIGEATNQLSRATPGENFHVAVSKPVSRSSGDFWYARRKAWLIVLALFFMVRSYSAITPPFQSPDEFNHVKRAYLLSKGIFLATVTEGVVGGRIDTGLMDYMKCFGNIPFNYGKKIDRTTVRECNEIRFEGRTTFSSIPNTATYFPLLYSPQALALFVGRIGGLTVGTSYFLARLFSQLASLSLIFLSMTIVPLPPAVMALLLLPMCLFQLASASLDAMSFSTAVVISALFIRASDRRLPFESGMRFSLSISILLLSLARIIYIALAPLLLFLYYTRRSRSYILYFVVISCSWIVWILYIRSAILGAYPHESSVEHSVGAWAYVSQAREFCVALFKTLTTFIIVKGYVQSFIGVLGASDTPLGPFAYIIFFVGILAITALSIDVHGNSVIRGGRAILGLAAPATLLFVFFAAFSEWTVPGGTIDGIQGRYFYPTAIFFLYSACGVRVSGNRATACLAVIALMALSSIELSIPALIDRYWASEFAEAYYSK